MIGNDVWMAMGHYSIGRYCRRWCRCWPMAVIAKDVPPYAVVAGNPARVLKMRFRCRDELRDSFASKWWDWPEDRISANIALLCSSRIGEFPGRNGF